MGGRSSGPLVPWSAGPLVRLSPGPLVLWSAGPLVLWTSEAETDSPASSQLAAAKWGYSCGTHILIQSLVSLQLCNSAEISGSQSALAVQSELPQHWFDIEEDAFLATPRLLSHTMSCLNVIYAEMSLPSDQRAGTQAVSTPGGHQPTLSNRGAALSKALRRNRHKGFLTMSDVKPHITSRLRTPEEYQAIFQLAESLSIGVIQGHYPGTRTEPFALKLTLSKATQQTRSRFNLEAGVSQLIAAGSHKCFAVCPHTICSMSYLDFGDAFCGQPNACVPLHLFMSVCLSPAPLAVQSGLVDVLMALSTGSMLDVTPDFDLGHPSSLHRFHLLAQDMKLQVALLYVHVSFASRRMFSADNCLAAKRQTFASLQCLCPCKINIVYLFAETPKALLP